MNTLAPLIELQQVACEHDGRRLFRNLNVSIFPGDVVQIGGANGVGKTTLLRALAGLTTIAQGSILFKSQPVDQVTWDFSQNRLYLGHLAGIKKTLTPEENLEWYAAQGPVKADVASVIADVGLSGYEDTPCYQLSAGQQRRVSLARLYLCEASIWILDEPFTAIDKQGVAHLERLINEHSARGGIVILTSHQDLTLPHVRFINLQDFRVSASQYEECASE